MELRKIKSNRYFEKASVTQAKIEAERRRREAAKRRKQNRARKPRD